MLEGGDMIVGLYNLPTVKIDEKIKIKRAFIDAGCFKVFYCHRIWKSDWLCLL